MGKIIELGAFKKPPKEKAADTLPEASDSQVVKFEKTPERLLRAFKAREEKLQKKLQMVELAYSTSGDIVAVLEKCALLKEETRAYLKSIAEAWDEVSWSQEESDKLTEVQGVANEMNWRVNDIIQEITYGKKADY